VAPQPGDPVIPPSVPAAENNGAAPQQIGNYLVLNRLGEGANGVVYRVQPVGGKSEFALKWLRTADESLINRLTREIHAILRLDHPHIIRIYTWGLHENRPYLVMDLADGGTLAEYCAASWRARIDVPELNRFAADTVSALAHIHARGMLHRDIKPTNLLVTAAGIKLTDFGLAAPETRLERALDAGTVTGTLAYLAPERFLGRPEDARSDLYSLGITLYEVTAGRRPFIADDAAGLIAEHIHRPPPLPAQFRPDFPAEWVTVLLRLLAKRPEDRFQTAQDLLNHLPRSGTAGHVGASATPSSALAAVHHLPVNLPTAPLLGRAAPLAAAQELIRDLQQGTSACFVMQAAPEAGSRRLSAEIAALARQRGVAVVSAMADGSLDSLFSPFDAIARALERGQGSIDSPAWTLAPDERMVISRFLPVAVAEAGDGEPAAKHSAGKRFHFYDLFRQSLLRAARPAPLLLICGGLHRAEIAAVILLANIIERALFPRSDAGGYERGQTGLGFVISYDPQQLTPPAREHIDRILSVYPINSVKLEPLSFEQTGELLAALLGEPISLESGAAAFFHQTSDGMPGRTVKLLKLLIKHGLLTQRDGAWHLSDRSGKWIPLAQAGDQEFPPPEQLRRLEQQLPAGSGGPLYRALAVLALIGQPAPLELFQEATGDGALAQTALEQLTQLDMAQRSDDLEEIWRLGWSVSADALRAELDPLARRLAARQVLAVASRGQRPLLGPNALARLALNAGWLGQAAEHLGRAAEAAVRVEAESAAQRAWNEVLELVRSVKPVPDSDPLSNLAFGPDIPAAAAQIWRRERQLQHAINSREALILKANQQLGLLHQTAGDYSRALGYFARALRSARTAGLSNDAADLMRQIGQVHYFLRKFNRAGRAFQQSLEWYQQLNDTRGQANCLNSIGAIRQAAGDLPGAQTSFSLALLMWRKLGDTRGLSYSLNNLGSIQYNQNDYAGALLSFQEAASALRSIGDPVGQAYALTNLGNTHRALGQIRQARDSLVAALELRRQLGDRRTIQQTLKRVGELCLFLGELQEAEDAFTEALDVLPHTAGLFLHGPLLLDLARLRWETGLPAAAEQVIARIRSLPGLDAIHRAEEFRMQLHLFSAEMRGDAVQLAEAAEALVDRMTATGQLLLACRIALDSALPLEDMGAIHAAARLGQRAKELLVHGAWLEQLQDTVLSALLAVRATGDAAALAQLAACYEQAISRGLSRSGWFISSRISSTLVANDPAAAAEWLARTLRLLLPHIRCLRDAAARRGTVARVWTDERKRLLADAGPADARRLAAEADAYLDR